MRGYLPYVQGKYKLIIETTGTASITLTEDDIIDGYALSIKTKMISIIELLYHTLILIETIR